MDKTKSDKERDLVIERLIILSPTMRFSVGDVGGNHTFTPAQLISEVSKGTPVGKDYIKTQLDFLRALKDGSLMNILTA